MSYFKSVVDNLRGKVTPKRESSGQSSKTETESVTSVSFPIEKLRGSVSMNLNFELEMTISVITKSGNIKIDTLLEPLINLKRLYKGDLKLRDLWTTLALLSAVKLKYQREYLELHYYKVTVCTGMNLGIVSNRKIEIGEKQTWNQVFNLLSDGVRTEWSFSGEIQYTARKYEPFLANEAVLAYLNKNGIPCKSEGNVRTLFQLEV